MIEPPKRPTAADVARRSGVSRATVSYVLNDTPGHTISENTRDRVLTAAADLGYIPSAFAQALAKGNSRIVVIDLSEIPNGETIANFGREIAMAFDSRGYLPIVDQPQRSSGDTHARLLALATMLAPKTVVSATPLPALIHDRLVAAGVEYFAVLLPGEGSFVKRIDMAAHTQMKYLISRGHHTIAYCGTDQSHLSELDVVRRTAATAEAVAHGVRLVDLGSHHDPASITAALRTARSTFPELSAVAAYNDEIAFATLSAAHRLGLRIPQQIAVIGIDDTPLSGSAYPSLTSVGYDAGERSADEYVDHILAGGTIVPNLTFRVSVRESA